MFVDASAMTAILLSETDAEDLLERLEGAQTRRTSAIAIFETVRALMRAAEIEPDEARSWVDGFMAAERIELVHVGPEAGKLALEAMARFGKGRHPAQLNMGDCFAYACARRLDAPLLYKGDDFIKTDIRTS